MRLKVEAFYEQKVLTKSVVLIPPFIQTIRKLQEYLIPKLYVNVPLSSEIFLTLDDFALDINNPINILSHNDIIRIDVNAKEEYKTVDQSNIVQGLPLFSSSENSFFFGNHDKSDCVSKNLHAVSENNALIVPHNPITTNPTMQHLINNISKPSNVVTIDKTLKHFGKYKRKVDKCILGKIKRKSVSSLRLGKMLQKSTSKHDIIKLLRKPRQSLMTKKNKINKEKKIAVISMNKKMCKKKEQAIQKSNSKCLNKQTTKSKSTNENDFVESNNLRSFSSPCETHLFTRSNGTEALEYNIPKHSQVKNGTHTNDSGFFMPINKNKGVCYQKDNESPCEIMKNPVVQTAKKIGKNNRHQSLNRTSLESGNVGISVIESSSTFHDLSSSEATSRSESIRLSRSSSGSTRESNRSDDSTRESSNSAGSSTTGSCSSGSRSENCANTSSSHSSDESSISENNERSSKRNKTESTALKEYSFNCNHSDTHGAFETKNHQCFLNKHTSKMAKENSNKSLSIQNSRDFHSSLGGGKVSGSHPIHSNLTTFNFDYCLSVGDQISYNIVTLTEGCPEMSDTMTGEVIEITNDTNLDENESYVYLKSLYPQNDKISRYSSFNLINIRHLKPRDINKVTKSHCPKQIGEENIQDFQNLTTCASYTQHHPVLGDVEIPSSLTSDQINHLIETKISAVKSAVRRQIDFYFSEQNYSRDKFLQSREDKEGWIPLVLVASFNRIRRLTSNLEFIKSCINDLSHVEISLCKTKLRRKHVNGKTTKRERYNPHRTKSHV